MVPLPTLLSDLHLLYLDGHLVGNVVSALDTLYTAASQARVPDPVDSNAACHERWLMSAELPSTALKFVFWLRAAPHTHMSYKQELHCFLCRSPCHSWGLHLYYDCLSTALACLHGSKALASSLQPESSVQWLTVDKFRVSVGDNELVWALVHPATSLRPAADVAISWSGAVTVVPGVPLPAESRDWQSMCFCLRLPNGTSWGLRSAAKAYVWHQPRPTGRDPTHGQQWLLPLLLLMLVHQLISLETPSPWACPRPPLPWSCPNGALMCAYLLTHRPPGGWASGSSQMQTYSLPLLTGST